MLESFKYGLSVTWRKSLLIIILFLYEMFWGFLLYRYVKSVLVPILYRYPGQEVPTWSSLFWIEGEFRLVKTDMASIYIWTLASLLLVRLLLTPLINAGLFHAIHHEAQEQWRSFLNGIRTRWGKFLSLYGVQMVLTLAPLYWLVPHLATALQERSLTNVHMMNSALLIASYLAYVAFVRLCFMYLQFAVTASDSLGSAFLIWCKRQLPLIGLSLIILLIAIVLQGMLTAVSMFWAGLTTLIVYQATPLVRVLLQVWEIAAQHDLWLKSRRS